MDLHESSIITISKTECSVKVSVHYSFIQPYSISCDMGRIQSDNMPKYYKKTTNLSDCSTAVKKHYDQGNSYDGRLLIWGLIRMKRVTLLSSERKHHNGQAQAELFHPDTQEAERNTCLALVF